jgi:hypothetical protein
MLNTLKKIVRSEVFRVYVVMIPTWILFFLLKMDFRPYDHGNGTMTISIREGMGRYKDVFLNLYILSLMLSVYDAAFISFKKKECEVKTPRKKIRAKKAAY